MKKFLLVFVSACLAAVMFVCGCATDGKDGRDGIDGQNVTIEEIYKKYVDEYGEISYEEFLLKIFSYTNSELDELTGLKSRINKSLMSGVTILSRFGYSVKGGISLLPSYSVYNVYTGSGAILWLDKEAGDAYVVTNCHVVYDDTADSVFCNDVRLYLYGQDESGVNFKVTKSQIRDYSSYDITDDEDYCIKAEVIGASVNYDIALLKVSGSEVLKRSGATVAEFSDGFDVTVGETVYTIGNASGEGMSSSSGIVSKDSEFITLTMSSEDEEYLSDDDYISYRVMRITAPINHGNSGGALYNLEGKIIGIVNAKDEEQGVENMGYALPGKSVNMLLGLMYDNYKDNGFKMKSGGGIDKAIIGITTEISDSYSRYNESTATAEIIHQVKVRDVNSNPAKGKLEKGDYLKSAEIISSDGTVKVARFDIIRDYYLREAMLSVRKGDKVKLTVERGGQNVDLELVFDSDKYFTHVG